MRIDHKRHNVSFAALCVALIVVTLLFGLRAKYSDTVYWSVAVLQFTAIVVAAWKVAASAVRSGTARRRQLALAGALLILPWALFSFLPGIGPPGDQTPTENELRYLILLINAIAIAVGFGILRETLADAGEGFFSALGNSTILLATPLYLVWATIAVGYFRAKQGTGAVPGAVVTLAELSEILLFFGGALTYVAAAAFAESLGRSEWIGRRTSRLFVTLSLLALLFLIVRGLWFPNPKVAFAHWYAIPGFVAGIPAVPWMIPLLLGVAVLRRAGSDAS